MCLPSFPEHLAPCSEAVVGKAAMNIRVSSLGYYNRAVNGRGMTRQYRNKVFVFGAASIIASCLPAVSAARPNICTATLSSRYSREGERVLHYLVQALAKVGIGRFYYESAVPVCPADGRATLPIPTLQLGKSAPSANGIAAIREALRGNPCVSVTQDISGMPRIEVGAVPERILWTRISRLSLDSTARFNPDMVVGALFLTREIRDAMRVEGYSEPPRSLHPPIIVGTAGLPQFPAVTVNMTLDQALDSVARTFGGIVIVGNCTHPREITAEFIALHRVPASGI